MPADDAVRDIGDYLKVVNTLNLTNNRAPVNLDREIGKIFDNRVRFGRKLMISIHLQISKISAQFNRLPGLNKTNRKGRSPARREPRNHLPELCLSLRAAGRCRGHPRPRSFQFFIDLASFFRLAGQIVEFSKLGAEQAA